MKTYLIVLDEISYLGGVIFSYVRKTHTIEKNESILTHLQKTEPSHVWEKNLSINGTDEWLGWNNGELWARYSVAP